MHKLIGSILASNFRRLSAPIKLSYAVTYRCNLKCSMCRIWDKEHSRQELSPSDLDAFLKGARNVYWFGITGGEPFLREGVFDIAEAAIKNCPDLKAVHFATNGTLTDRIDQFMQRLRKMNEKIQIVTTISIDGPPHVHNTIRGAQGVWDKALESFHLLKQFPRTKPQFGFTLSHNNMDQFEPAFLALKQDYPALKFDDMTVNIFQRSSFYYENHSMPALEKEKVENSIKAIQQMDKGAPSFNSLLRRVYLKLYLRYLRTGKTPLKCQSFSSTAFLDPYGDFFPCAVYNRKFINIKDAGIPLKEAWKKKEAELIHKECAKLKCPNCWSPCDAYSAIGGSLIPALVKR